LLDIACEANKKTHNSDDIRLLGPATHRTNGA
jgi:hypothetical protein